MIITEDTAKYIDSLYINEPDNNTKNIIERLAVCLYKKDFETYTHSLRVAKLSLMIAKKMYNDKYTKNFVYISAFLHDIGKTCIDRDFLVKQTNLLSNEYEAIKKHPQLGEKLLADMNIDKNICAAVRSHHEKYDGTGYPDKLCGNEIPFAARIISVADAYDAMLSRKYSENKDRQKAIYEIIKNSGYQFDSEIANSIIDF